MFASTRSMGPRDAQAAEAPRKRPEGASQARPISSETAF